MVASTGVPMNASSFCVWITASITPRSISVASSAVTAPPSWAPSGRASARADTACCTSPTGFSASWWFSFSGRKPAIGQ